MCRIAERIKNIKKSQKENTHTDFKEKWKKIKLSDKINLFLAICTVISLVLVTLTLLEMIKDRNTAYKPAIAINPIEQSFTWNTTGEETGLISLDEEQVTSKKDEEKNSAGEASFNGLEKISILNIGVGTAKDVVFEWHSSNIDRLNEYLLECDPSKTDFLVKKERVVFNYNEKKISTGLPTKMRLMYMLPEAQEEYTLSIPIVYSRLIHEIIKTGKHHNEIPYLILSVTYYDIQNKKHIDVFLINVDLLMSQHEETGAGSAVYMLVPTISQ